MFRIFLSMLFALGLGFSTIGCDRQEREYETTEGEVEVEREPLTGDREVEVETPRNRNDVID